MDKYAATLNFFCSLPLEFLNSLPDKDFFTTLPSGHQAIVFLQKQKKTCCCNSLIAINKGVVLDNEI